jgi:two-component system, cell cycle response regulator DivK
VLECDETKVLVLVVEDNGTNARLTGGMLEAAGYRVAFAADGELGFQLARQLRPALVVTDLQMPGVDGLALLRLLATDPATQHIPVVVLTAHVMQEHRDRATQASCRSFISKPVRYQTFIAEIARVLRESLSGACRDT